MPTYNYTCDDCLEYAKEKLGVEELNDEQESVFVFESRYGFTAKPEVIKTATECPFCDGHNTRKLITAPIHVRVKGHNWEEFRRNNQAAIRRDMALHQLEGIDEDTGKPNDPYDHMRQPGEKEDMAHRLRKARLKQTDKKHFLT